MKGRSVFQEEGISIIDFDLTGPVPRVCLVVNCESTMPRRNTTKLERPTTAVI